MSRFIPADHKTGYLLTILVCDYVAGIFSSRIDYFGSMWFLKRCIGALCSD